MQLGVWENLQCMSCFLDNRADTPKPRNNEARKSWPLSHSGKESSHHQILLTTAKTVKGQNRCDMQLILRKGGHVMDGELVAIPKDIMGQ